MWIFLNMFSYIINDRKFFWTLCRTPPHPSPNSPQSAVCIGLICAYLYHYANQFIQRHPYTDFVLSKEQQITRQNMT